MNNLRQLIEDYMEFCHYQKNLNQKTINAYRIDLGQYYGHMKEDDMAFKRNYITNYITYLHKRYKPKSVKRKVASLKAFFSYWEYEEILPENPFSKIKVKFQESSLLPRTIPTGSLQKLFQAAYENREAEGVSEYQEKSAVRDVAVLELLFSTGLRVSELCSLKCRDIDLEQGSVRIYGKGSKERIVLLTNVQVLNALVAYQKLFQKDIREEGFFFCNRLGNRLSEQSVRFMINRYADTARLTEHITPHMFQHTFATLLLEEDVDIRYIQQILGHSSIITTQIYTHVTAYKQRDILMAKNPRNKLRF
ncbi:tyrosine-type recombinase/integrase [Lacrimispora sp.]|uniref:tyrosine-type recombinase/integrase n=1 Tax=Lacrimispora sp. TaxID=2719234 RepID=UPI002FDAEFEB